MAAEQRHLEVLFDSSEVQLNNVCYTLMMHRCLLVPVCMEDNLTLITAEKFFLESEIPRLCKSLHVARAGFYKAVFHNL